MKKSTLYTATLLVVPLLLLTAQWLFADATMADIHFHDTYIVIDSHLPVFALFLLLLPGFMLQVLLRKGKRPFSQFCQLHAIGSVLLFIAAYIFFELMQSGTDGIPRRYYGAAEFENQLVWGNNQLYFAAVLLLLVLLQLIFMMYALVKLFKKAA